jgi:hypothetical protein
MSARYDHYRSQPFQDIAKADELLNPDDGFPTANDLLKATALSALAQAKMMGGGRA